MDYRDRHVVVTGGTGALGTATVGALIEAGAVCHVPYIDRAEADRFAFRNHAKIELIADIDLAQEAAVAKLYGSVPLRSTSSAVLPWPPSRRRRSPI
jgi:NAD(P)-dependent dehydrogenase (short-subunit alcohol dehydrogenase family)